MVILAAIPIGVLLGYGYWRFVVYPTTPQYALDRFFQAARAKDYDTLYDLVQINGVLKVMMPNSARLKELAKTMPGLVPDVESYRFGNAIVTGDRATVETTATTRRNGKESTDTLKVEMVRTNGLWRIDGGWIFKEATRRGMGGVFLAD